MGDRVVDCARLESVCAFTGTGGSNPPPSAALIFKALRVWNAKLRAVGTSLVSLRKLKLNFTPIISSASNAHYLVMQKSKQSPLSDNRLTAVPLHGFVISRYLPFARHRLIPPKDERKEIMRFVFRQIEDFDKIEA